MREYREHAINFGEEMVHLGMRTNEKVRGSETMILVSVLKVE